VDALQEALSARPEWGRASSAVLEVEISTFRIEQQPKLRELYFVKNLVDHHSRYFERR
jgi:hypothetical protein